MNKLRLYLLKDKEYARQVYLVVFDDATPSETEIREFVEVMRYPLYR